MNVQRLESLIQACKQNDPEAQRQIYDHYGPKLFYLAKRYCNDKRDAEEALSDGFLRIFQQINNYNYRGSFEGWMRIIITHAAADRIKPNKFKWHKSTLVSTEINEMYESTMVCNGFNEVKEQIDVALQLLPPQENKIIKLKATGYKDREIAEAIRNKQWGKVKDLIDVKKETKIDNGFVAFTKIINKTINHSPKSNLYYWLFDNKKDKPKLESYINYNVDDADKNIKIMI